MSFRVILIENSNKLRYKLDSVIATVDNKEVVIPLSDISTIVIDNFDTTVTTRLLSMLSENNVCLVTCDHKHLPSGIFLPLNTHSRASKIIQKQINIDEEFRGLVWKKIMERKIENQIRLLMETRSSQKSIDRLTDYYINIKPFDITNREGHAAKVYFNELMGKNFTRGDASFMFNSGVNYGYTILRSYIARLCVGYGLNTMIGIHHKNEYNQFNLVDDLIEPFRPLIDKFVLKNIAGEQFFTYDHRVSLINILNHKIKFNGKNQYLSNAIDEYVHKYSAMLDKGDINLFIMPELSKYLGEENEV